MAETPVVTVFLRNGTDVLLLRRSDAVGSYPGRWGAVAGHAEGNPDEAARREIAEETGIDPETAVTLRRRGDTFEVVDEAVSTRWRVHPFLFDCATRRVEPNEESSAVEWAPPTAILRRETVPELWTSYERVRPTVDTIGADREHGAADLSLRALEVLRDEAALAVERSQTEWADLTTTAQALIEARPAMPVLTTRVDRAMAEANSTGTPDALEAAATTGLDHALAADDEAAATAADQLEAMRVATVSRSGTVYSTLEYSDPAAVLVAESRPGGEGVAVASSLAARLDAPVTLTTDAAFSSRLEAWSADAVLVGADAVFPDGAVRNKVGTRGAALAAAHEGIRCLAVAAAAKITPDESLPDEPRPAGELTDDDDVLVDSPTFERTPARLIDAVITEDGALGTEDIAARAELHRDWRRWRK